MIENDWDKLTECGFYQPQSPETLTQEKRTLHVSLPDYTLGARYLQTAQMVPEDPSQPIELYARAAKTEMNGQTVFGDWVKQEGATS